MKKYIWTEERNQPEGPKLEVPLTHHPSLFSDERTHPPPHLHHRRSRLNKAPNMATDPAGGVGVDDLSSSSPVAFFYRWNLNISRKYQHLLDKSTPFILNRWIGFLGVAFIYIVRVYFIQGFYIVSYGLGIYILNLLIGFLSPQDDPEIQALVDGPTLPTRGSDEFRPFVRRLPEFKFWCVNCYFTCIV